MKVLQRAALVSLLLTVTGCGLVLPTETLYLKSAEGQATQEEVRQRLGQPLLVAATKSGESVWVYQVREMEPASASSWGTRGSWCDEYVLTFDKQGVLRRWTHKSQLHGGEMMPTYCVAGGFRPAS